MKSLGARVLAAVVAGAAILGLTMLFGIWFDARAALFLAGVLFVGVLRYEA